MNDFELTYTQVYLLAIIVGAFVGALLGLVPLMLGRGRGNARLGRYGFIASTIAGGIFLPLALIVTGIFAFVIIRNSGSNASKGSDADANEGTAS